MTIIKMDNILVAEPVQGFRVKFIHSENTTTAFWEIKAGSELPEHSHIHEQVTMLTEGIAEITINGNLQKLQSGDVVIIPSNIPHSAKFVSDCKITDVFSPVREDFRNITLQIVDYTTEHQTRFKEINIAWITKSFVMEEIDEQVLNNPDEYILKNGGAILMATYKGEIVGTCALIKEGEGIYELTKMGVDEKYRGLKIGFHLGVATLNKAKELGAKKVILYSNTVHSAIAINLYRNLGFKEVPLDNALWVRADIKMEIEFGENKK